MGDVTAPARALQQINLRAAAIPAAAVIGGGALAFTSMAASKDNHGPSRGMALASSFGLGAAAVGAGLILAKRAGGAEGIMGTIRSALSATNASGQAKAAVGLMAAGAGAVALGAIGGLTQHVIPAAQQNYNTISRDSVGGKLPSADRALLAAVASDSKGGVGATLKAFKEISNNDKIAEATTTTDRVLLTAAQLDAGVDNDTVEQVVVGTNSALWIPEQGKFEIEDPSTRMKIAAAGIRGRIDLVQDDNKFLNAGRMFQNITDGLPETSENTRVELAIAALEGTVPSPNVVGLYSSIARAPRAAGLSEEGIKDLTVGSLRHGLYTGGAIDPDLALREFDAIQNDGYLGSKPLSQALTGDQQAKLAGAALEVGLGGQYAADTLVNIYADEFVYDNASIDQALELATATLRAWPETTRTSSEAAGVFKDLSTSKSTKGLDADQRVQLTAGWLESGQKKTGKAADVYGDFTTKDAKERIMLSAGEMGGLDMSSPSTVLDGYLKAEA